MFLDELDERITVGIPYYQDTIKTELVAAIDSILKQSKQPDEIHLIQDGPVPDELTELVKEYLGNNNVFTKIVIPVRSGLAYALNISILNSKTSLYARMDSDDISHPQRLEKQYAFLRENPNIDIVGTWLTEFEDDINKPTDRIRKVPPDQESIYRLFHYRNPMNHPTLLFRRGVFAKIGLYDSSFFRAQDTELYARAFKKNIEVDNIPEILYYMRTDDIVGKRSTMEHIKYQVLGRYKYNTWSLTLNALKIISILFRFMPKRIQRLGYDKFKW